MLRLRISGVPSTENIVNNPRKLARMEAGPADGGVADADGEAGRHTNPCIPHEAGGLNRTVLRGAERAPAVGFRPDEELTRPG